MAGVVVATGPGWPEKRRPGGILTLAAWLALLGSLSGSPAQAESADRAWPRILSAAPAPDSLDAYGHLGLGKEPALPRAGIVDDPLSGSLGGAGSDMGWRLRGDHLTLRMAPLVGGRMEFNSRLDVSDRRLTVGVGMRF